MTVTVDYYKELELERTWDEKILKREIRDRQSFWIRRNNSCNDKEQLILIKEMLSKAEKAFRYLTKPKKRKEYDKELDEAYKKGLIHDEKEEEFKSALEKALEYYRKGDIKLSAQYAQEAVNGKINEPRAWDILARCHYDAGNYEKALNTVDDGLKIFGDNIGLNWLGARIAIVGTQNYNEAQQRVNRLIEIAPNQSVGYAEQIYLHMSKGNEELAFQEIDQYIEKHPNDNEFRKESAYNAIHFSDTSYVQDPQTGVYVIADKKGYERCLGIREKAVRIFRDEYTEQQLEETRYFGKLEFNEDNKSDLKWMYGVFLYMFVCLVGGTIGGSAQPGELLAVGLLCLGLGIPPFILTYVSFRPYWQLNRIYLTGDPGKLEKRVILFGRIYTWLLRKVLWVFWTIFKLVSATIIGIAMRR